MPRHKAPRRIFACPDTEKWKIKAQTYFLNYFNRKERSDGERTPEMCVTCWKIDFDCHDDHQKIVLERKKDLTFTRGVFTKLAKENGQYQEKKNRVALLHITTAVKAEYKEVFARIKRQLTRAQEGRSASPQKAVGARRKREAKSPKSESAEHSQPKRQKLFELSETKQDQEGPAPHFGRVEKKRSKASTQTESRRKSRSMEPERSRKFEGSLGQEVRVDLFEDENPNRALDFSCRVKSCLNDLEENPPTQPNLNDLISHAGQGSRSDWSRSAAKPRRSNTPDQLSQLLKFSQKASDKGDTILDIIRRENQSEVERCLEAIADIAKQSQAAIVNQVRKVEKQLRSNGLASLRLRALPLKAEHVVEMEIAVAANRKSQQQKQQFNKRSVSEYSYQKYSQISKISKVSHYSQDLVEEEEVRHSSSGQFDQFEKEKNAKMADQSFESKSRCSQRPASYYRANPKRNETLAKFVRRAASMSKSPPARSPRVSAHQEQMPYSQMVKPGASPIRGYARQIFSRRKPFL